MPPEFIYFDIGNVLLHFDFARAARQMAEVAGCDETKIHQALVDPELQYQYETGAISSQAFYDVVCERIGCRPDYDAFALAAAEMFTVNYSILPLVGALVSARFRLGLLSNTCDIHWNYYADGRYGILPDRFEQQVLSFRLGTVKPEAAIFEHAIRQAGVAPEKIFYVDDIAGHVAAAKKLGIDAMLYRSTEEVAVALRERGARFNY